MPAGAAVELDITTNGAAVPYLKTSYEIDWLSGELPTVTAVRVCMVPAVPTQYEYRLLRSGEKPISPVSEEYWPFSAAYAFSAANIALRFVFASLCFERACEEANRAVA